MTTIRAIGRLVHRKRPRRVAPRHRGDSRRRPGAGHRVCHRTSVTLNVFLLTRVSRLFFMWPVVADVTGGMVKYQLSTRRRGALPVYKWQGGLT